MNSGGVFVALAAFCLIAAVTGRAAPGVSTDEVVASAELPRSLKEFGFFEDPAAQVPAENVFPYRLNTPLYSDGAEKLRFVYLPAGMKVGIGESGLLEFPAGSALIKTFAFGVGAERKLIETRVLLHRADGWLALPYRWDDEQRDARLAVAGARVDLTTPRGEAISYRVPNKNQCKECHGLNGAVIPIGPKARNMSTEWLANMVEAGHLDELPHGSDRLPVWEQRASHDSAEVARAYLDVNCAHCHRPMAGASNSGLDLRWEQDDPKALGILKRPVAAGRGAGSNLFDIVPGKPEESIMLHRMLSDEPGVAMPELGKATIDQEGAEAVRKWIVDMR